MEDPIAVPIKDLEQDKNGNPKEFNTLMKDMMAGKQGKIRIVNANRLLPKVTYILIVLFKYSYLTFCLLTRTTTTTTKLEKCPTGHILLCKSNWIGLFVCLQSVRHGYG